MKKVKRSSAVQGWFNVSSNKYDLHRKQLIPCFDEFYGALTTVAQTKSQTPKILDLGAGTGLVSVLLRKKYPKASFVLVDVAEDMLDIALEKLGPAAACVVADYTQLPLTGPFDLVVSALSIHHLSRKQKQQLYKRIFTIVKPGGLFINADQILGATPGMEKLFKQEWKKRIDASGLPLRYRQLVYSRMRLDREEPLTLQLAWLRQSGFKDVECVYQWFPFAVMLGKKPSRRK